jgi:metal-sulfur cluster biosynthetic enzyme
MISASRILDAIAEVYDPELDEPITELRFVTSCQVTAAGDVEILLRLPTPQCAPNFAYLMAADTRRAVQRLPEVRHVRVRLDDHYTSEEINAALARGEGFSGAFPGETDDDHLDALRQVFQRKALLGRQGRLCEALLADGATPEQVAELCVAELPDVPDSRRCLELRAQLGIPSRRDSPAFVQSSGERFAAGELTPWLRMARLVRTSLDVNGGICRSLLEIRHQLPSTPQEEHQARRPTARLP